MPLTRSDVRCLYCRGPPFFCRPPSKQMEPRALLYDALPVVVLLPPAPSAPLPPLDAAVAAPPEALPLPAVPPSPTPPLPSPTPAPVPSKLTRLGRCCPEDDLPPALAAMSESELAMPPGRQLLVWFVYTGVSESREWEKQVCVK